MALKPELPELLVLRGLGLGDLLTAVPALRALRRAFPGHRLVLAAPAPLAELLPLIGGVDGLRDVRGPGPVPATDPPPDVAVNLHGRGPQSTDALRRTRPGRLLAHAPEPGGPPWREDLHEVRRWCAFLDWYGIPADPDDLAVRMPDAGFAEGLPAGAVVVHPGAASAARRWPPERFAEVAAALPGVVITGVERELGLCVAALAGLPEERVLRTGLCELAALIGRARLVVCGDTGVAHLATALGTPSVVLFGPVPPALWGPPANGRHVVLWTGRRGDPHAPRPDPGLLEIDVPDVLDAALGLLEVNV
ncbi:glycosyltransferase family 9 protein [Microtetraspora fusca]|uniref:Glycosyltransferase family 9 protein n=1 Tax=Microtetraspora fusca TaxID=1997 RepID=A0ABW6VDI7_MICFU